MKTVVLALVFAYALVPVVFAHEGHDHKIMGTVAAVHENRVEVKGTDGKMSTFSLTEKTKIVQGTAPIKLADLKAGDRVVVTAEGGAKTPLIAKEIRIGAAPAKSSAVKSTVKK